MIPKNINEGKYREVLPFFFCNDEYSRRLKSKVKKVLIKRKRKFHSIDNTMFIEVNGTEDTDKMSRLVEKVRKKYHDHIINTLTS